MYTSLWAPRNWSFFNLLLIAKNNRLHRCTTMIINASTTKTECNKPRCEKILWHYIHCRFLASSKSTQHQLGFYNYIIIHSYVTPFYYFITLLSLSPTALLLVSIINTVLYYQLGTGGCTQKENPLQGI